jgi:hypothetical protein
MTALPTQFKQGTIWINKQLLLMTAEEREEEKRPGRSVY